jgi:hypothetical protein
MELSGNLHRFADFIQSRQRETGAWRGTVAGGVSTGDAGGARTPSTSDIARPSGRRGARAPRPAPPATAEFPADAHGAHPTVRRSCRSSHAFVCPDRVADAAPCRPTPASSLSDPAQRRRRRPPLPDRLSIDPRSPHHVAAVFEHGVGIRLNGKERFDVEEYCLSEGWIKVPAGKTLDRKGRPLLITLKGKVEAFYR